MIMMMRGKKANQVNIVVGNETEMEQKKMVQNGTKRQLGVVHKLCHQVRVRKIMEFVKQMRQRDFKGNPLFLIDTRTYKLREII